MKKIILLISAALFAGGSMAQVATTSMVRLNGYSQDKTASKGLKEQFLNARLQRQSAQTANKGTGGSTKRTYNYVDYLAKANGAILTDLSYLYLPYMWFSPDVFGVYKEGNSFVADTVRLSSYGFVLHPSWIGYADRNAYPERTMVVTSDNTYTLDSVRVYGVYGRNRANTAAVDTLRIGMTYGNGGTTNIGLGYYTGMTNRYQADTVNTAIINFDDITHTLTKSAASTGPAIVYKDIYLTSADTAKIDFSIATNMVVPAGNNLIAVTVTFKSGEAYTPYHDSVFVGSLDTVTPFRRGMFLPLVFLEDKTAFPSYFPSSYNSGQFKVLPDLSLEYGPTWGWYSTTRTGSTVPSGYQFPYIDFVVSCADCKGVSVATTSPVQISGVYPNPANNQVNISIKVKEAATVKAAITDLTGKQLNNNVLGKRGSGETVNASFNTAGLANGIYLLVVDADGIKTTSRFVVSR